MESAASLCYRSSFSVTIPSCQQKVGGFAPHLSRASTCFPLRTTFVGQRFNASGGKIHLSAVSGTISGLEDAEASTSVYKGFSITSQPLDEPCKLEISVKVSGPRTREIYDDVFGKMVAAAQPIPGFRRVKGGKTPNIPEDILLEILGPSKVYKEVIKKVINSTVAEYVEKENLAVSKDLRVSQSFEDLEASFEPDEEFKFDAVIQLKDE